MILDARGVEAGTAHRIFRAEEGRGEIIPALAHEDFQAAIFAQCLAQIGGDAAIDFAGPAAFAVQLPVPSADPADRHIGAVGPVAQIVAGIAVHRGGIGAVDGVETGIIIRLLARRVIILAGIAGIEAADAHAPVAQQFLVEAAGRNAQFGMIHERFGQAGQPCQFRPHARAFLGRELVALEQRCGIGADGEGAGLLRGFRHGRGRIAHALVIPGGRRHRRQVDDIGHFIALHLGRGAEVEDGRDQDDAVDRDIIIAALQFVDQRHRPGRAIAFAADIFGRRPAAIIVQPQADKFGDRFGIGGHAPIILGILLADRMGKAGADRIDEDEVGDVQQRFGIVHHWIGRRAVILRIGQHHPLGTEGAHVQPERSRAGAAIIEEGDGALLVTAILDIGSGIDGRERLAVLVLEIGFAGRRGVADRLAAEHALMLCDRHIGCGDGVFGGVVLLLAVVLGHGGGCGQGQRQCGEAGGEAHG